MNLHHKTMLSYALILALGACTNVENVRKFSASAKSLSSAAAEGYRGFDNVRLQAVRETRLATQTPVTPQDLQRLFVERERSKQVEDV